MASYTVNVALATPPVGNVLVTSGATTVNMSVDPVTSAAIGAAVAAANMSTFVMQANRSVNVRDHGAIGDGVTDSTAAIDSASAAARSAGFTLEFPPGNFVYNGTGTYDHPIRGAGPIKTVITLGSSSALVVSPPGPAQANVIDVEGVTAAGGCLIKLTYTGAQTDSNRKPFRVWNCRGSNGVGAWISSLSSNDYLWKITGCVVRWDNDAVGQIGVAIAAALAGSEFDVQCVGAQFAFKIGQANNLDLRGSLVRRTYSSFPRTDIWLVPGSNAGQGLVIRNYEFAPDGFSVGNDYRVLVADENTGSGSDFSTHPPAYTTVSSGFMTGFRITDSYMSDASSGTSGRLVYSTTPNLQNIAIDNCIFNNSRPVYLVEYMAGAIPGPLPTSDFNGQTTNSKFGPFTFSGPGLLETTMQASNAPGLGWVIDQDGIYSRDASQPQYVNASDATTGFTILKSDTTTGWGVTGAATKASVTDSIGGTDAWEVTTTVVDGAGDGYHVSTAAGTYPLNRRIFLEFDLQQGAASPAGGVYLRVRNATTTSQIHLIRAYPTLASEWVRHRVSFVPRTSTEAIDFQFYAHTTAGTYRIGRFRAYVGREPVQSSPVMPFALTTTSAPAAGGAGALPATPAGYVTETINGTARKLPYY